MILSGGRIRSEYEDGRIVLEPFDEKQLQPNGYDLTLGPWWWCPKRTFEDAHQATDYKPWDAQSQRDYWQEKPINAIDTNGRIIIPPYTLILGHTNEAAGARWGLVPSLACRSGLARSAITICACAGFGDDGYTGIWTLEIHNRTGSYVWLPVGVRIGQIVFEELLYTGEEHERANARQRGAYPDKGSYGRQHAEWTPEDMLPKLPNDPDIRDGESIRRVVRFMSHTQDGPMVKAR